MSVIITKLKEIFVELESLKESLDESLFSGNTKRLKAIVLTKYGTSSHFNDQIVEIEKAIERAPFGLHYRHITKLRTVISIVIDDIEINHFKETQKAEVIDTIEFVNRNVLMELRQTKSAKFDLCRLIKLCEEINANYRSENYLSVGMIGRTILNHVPPIFGYNNFDEVSSSYGGPKVGKSFKANMVHLNIYLRNIADSYLHQTIRSKEVTPNSTQVEFRQALDVLLEEVLRILK